MNIDNYAFYATGMFRLSSWDCTFRLAPLARIFPFHQISFLLQTLLTFFSAVSLPAEYFTFNGFVGSLPKYNARQYAFSP